MQKTYQKHHSFGNFQSNLGVDSDDQKQRALNILAQELEAAHSPKDNDIMRSVIRDLSLSSLKDDSFKITMHIADELSKLEDQCVGRYLVHRYRYDVYPKKKMLDDFPPYLQIEPTSICNYRCLFCYQIDKQFSNKSQGYMGSMSLEMFKSVIDQAEGKVDFISLASRGEPLICRNIDQMLEYCVGRFLGLKINTNASLLTEAHAHAILAGGVNTVVFSADAAKEPLYSKLRVGGKLQNVLDNISLFRKIKNKHYPQSNIITRVSGVKFDEQQDMAEMVETWGSLVDQVAFVNYNPWENIYESPVTCIDEPCSDLWRRMFVWYDGKVNPCDTDYRSHLAVGHVRAKSISDIWQSDVYTKLREDHLNNNRSNVNPCKRCHVI